MDVDYTLNGYRMAQKKHPETEKVLSQHQIRIKDK